MGREPMHFRGWCGKVNILHPEGYVRYTELPLPGTQVQRKREHEWGGFALSQENPAMRAHVIVNCRVSPLYQVGGPRSGQLTLKLEF